jgi:hypothetical protein
MPKSNHSDNSSSGLSTTTDTRSSKKWFSKISLKIPKKLKNGKGASTLSNTIHNAKKTLKSDSHSHHHHHHNKKLEITSQSKDDLNNSISDQTIPTSSNETSVTSVTSSDLLKNDLSIQFSQLTVNSNKSETTVSSSNNLQSATPIISITSEDVEDEENQNTDMTLKDTQTKKFNNLNADHCNFFNNINKVIGLRPNCGHCRSNSDYINIPIQRPRSYSDTPVPVNLSTLYSDEEYDRSLEMQGRSRSNKVAFGMLKNNSHYYNEKDFDLYDDIKTPVIPTRTTRHTSPIDDSHFSTPSNTIAGKLSLHNNTSDTNTPVLKHRDVKVTTTNSPSTPDHKLLDSFDSMTQKSCDTMTAKEFALAVGLNVRYEDDSDSSEDEEDDMENRSTVSNLSAALSQLTANGKIPTANEIYNALSVNSISHRQRRKYSAPILSLDMFIPPTQGECIKSASAAVHPTGKPSLLLNETFNNPNSSNSSSLCQRKFGDLSHKSSHPILERKLPSHISTTNKSNESSSTFINTSTSVGSGIGAGVGTGINKRFSSSSSIHSSQSGNTTACVSDLPESDFDSCGSSSSGHQFTMMNGNSFDGNVKNNISTTFYSLPRMNVHSHPSIKAISASKSINSISTSNLYASNHTSSYRDKGVNMGMGMNMNMGMSMGMGMNCHGPRHHCGNSLSINTQSFSFKMGPSSPLSISTNCSSLNEDYSPLNTIPSTKSNVSDTHNRYINSSNPISSIEKPSTTTTTTTTTATTTIKKKTTNYPMSSSWSNGLSEIENLRLSVKTPTNEPKEVSSSFNNINNVQVYTKGRFTITHETYHRRSISTHKIEIEKN